MVGFFRGGGGRGVGGGLLRGVFAGGVRWGEFGRID